MHEHKTHTQDIYYIHINIRICGTRGYIMLVHRNTKQHAPRCVERTGLKIKWKCIPDERNIVLSKGHVLYVCVVHSLNKNYI